MSGISSSTGLVSGLNTGALIEQLLQVEARPKALIQKRLAEVQKQQAAVLDLNSKLQALKSAAQKLRSSSIFDSAKASSSVSDVLTGTASPKATPGNYTFIVDRLVSTQQLLSRGFADRTTSSAGLTAVVVEPTQARLDTDTDLAQLNGGAGVPRGKIVVTNRAGTSATLDLTRAATVGEVVDAFNSNADLKVSARVQGGRLVLTDTSGGGGNLSVRSGAGYTTGAALGIEGTTASNTLTGTDVFRIGDGTSLRSLNDGLGARINPRAGTASYDLKITTRDGSVFNVDVGDAYANDGVTKTASAVTDVAQLKARIAAQTQGKVSLNVRPDGRGLELVDSTTGQSGFKVEDVDGSGFGADLGIAGTAASDTITGKTVLAGLNSTLLSGVRGGRGLSATDLVIRSRAGTDYAVDLSGAQSISDVLDAVNAATGGAVSASLDERGTRVVLTDQSGGTGNLNVTGGAAADLGLSPPTGGLAQGSYTGNRIERRYVGDGTLLTTLNGGKGVGTGSFRVVGSDGTAQTITVDSNVRTVGDLLRRFNSTGSVRARLNDAGNGILLEQNPGVAAGSNKLTVTDLNGGVAKALNLAGTASDLGASNFIDGSFRRTVSLTAADTLDAVITKINTARPGVTASVVVDGTSTTPFRLRLTSTQAGDAGRFQVETVGSDLGLRTIAKGVNSRVFYGSDDPATAILVSRDSNTVDGVVENLRVDVKSASATPVTLTVTRDDDAAAAAIQDFVKAFNTLSTRLGDLTKYDADTQVKGTLLGDSTALGLRQDLFSTVQATALGVGGKFKQLGQVGLSVNRDGTIAIDDGKLRSALADDPQAVADVFSAFEQQTAPQTTTISAGITTPNTAAPKNIRLGVLEKLVQLADRYLNSVDGVLTSRSKNMDSQVTALNDRISGFDDRLASKRTTLEKQFAALESTLANLQRQQASIAGLGSGASASR